MPGPNMPDSTFVALLTANGRAAVASVLVAGPEALDYVESQFFPLGKHRLAMQPVGRIVFGRWGSPVDGEEVVVARVADDRIEIHCHGGLAASRAIVEAVVECGGKELSWSEWVRRDTPDRLHAEATIALTQAETDRAARVLADQLGGALRRALESIGQTIAAKQFAVARQAVQVLLDRARVGVHLTTPWKVVLAGQPNVGKSSLINALLGYRRAIVHDTPGTTRDVLHASTAFDGWPVELSDTAGLRGTDQPLEAAGIALTRNHVRHADLVVLVFDGSQQARDAELALLAEFPQALVVINKCDLPGDADAITTRVADPIRLSALQGSGLDGLVAAIAARLVPEVPSPGAAVPFLPEHVTLLNQVLAAMDAEDADAATRALRDYVIC